MPFSLLTRPSRLQGDSSLILSQENISVLRATKKLGESDEDEEENDQNIQESSREIAEIVIPQGQHRTIETKATKQI